MRSSAAPLVTKWSLRAGAASITSGRPVLPEDEPTAKQVFERYSSASRSTGKDEEETVSHLRNRAPVAVLTRLRADSQPEGSDNYMEPRDTLYVDLRPTEEEILGPDEAKAGTTSASRSGRRFDRRGYLRARPRGFPEDLQENVLPSGNRREAWKLLQDLIAIAFALRQACSSSPKYGKRVAAALVTYLGRKATYFFGASLVPAPQMSWRLTAAFRIIAPGEGEGLRVVTTSGGSRPKDVPTIPWQDISAFQGAMFGGGPR